MNYETNAASRRTTYGAALALVLAAAPAMAGSDAKIAIEEPPANNGDWCTWLKSKPGTIYKNKENSIIQEVGFFGRLQYQQSWIDGESGGNDFWYDSEGEFRRLRIGAYVKFLDLFQLKANADMARDSRPKGGSLHLSYQNLYEAQLTFNAQKAFNIASHSKFTLGFGKSKIKLSSESIASSKKIKTIERSAIANKLLPTNLTGFWLDAQTGKISYYLGVFSTVRHNEIAGWDMGRLYTGRLGYDFTSSTSFDKAVATAGFIYADHENSSDSTIGFDWAASAAVEIKQGRANLLANVLWGENRDDASAVKNRRDGDFWGVVIMPTYWITPNRLEAVLRYQYAHASSVNGLRLNSRYARNAGEIEQENIGTLRSGRGDEHHSLYLGLNYYFCGDNSKIMAGVEWDDMSADGSEVFEGFTYSLAYRMYF